jgi:hypothetical protein
VQKLGVGASGHINLDDEACGDTRVLYAVRFAKLSGPHKRLAEWEERVRCSSLIDWPVYPRFRRAMRVSQRSCNRAHAAAGRQAKGERSIWLEAKGIVETDSLAAPKRTGYASLRGIGSLPTRRNSRSRLPASARPRRKPGAPHVHRLWLRKGQG